MLFLTHIQKIENSIEELDVNQLSNDYENFIVICLQDEDTRFNKRMELFAGADKNNYYILTNNKNVRLEIKTIFDTYNLHKKININKNFIIVKNLKSSLLTSDDDSAYLIELNNSKEVMECLDSLDKEQQIHNSFKFIGNTFFQHLLKQLPKLK